jgi:aprataxin
VYKIFILSYLFFKKKHWNSFTSEYFLDASDVIDNLQANGSVRIDTTRMEKLLASELKCHKCSNNFKTMPQLKQHLLSHTN